MQQSKQEIGARIARLRDEQGISIPVLAEATGMTPAQVEQVERGEIGFTAAQAWDMAETLGTKVSYLLGGEEAAEQPTLEELRQTVASCADPKLRKLLRSALKDIERKGLVK